MTKLKIRALALCAYLSAVGRKTGGPQTPELNMTCETLAAEFYGTGLNLEFLQSLERTCNEGTLHKGYAAVTQCVAFGLRQRMRRDDAIPPPPPVSGTPARSPVVCLSW